MREMKMELEYCTYKPWKNALLRYSKYAGAQSKNICNSVRDIHLITNLPSNVRAKLAPDFPLEREDRQRVQGWFRILVSKVANIVVFTQTYPLVAQLYAEDKL